MGDRGIKITVFIKTPSLKQRLLHTVRLRNYVTINTGVPPLIHKRVTMFLHYACVAHEHDTYSLTIKNNNLK